MKRLLQENWMTILVLALMIGGYVFLRTPGADLASASEFDTQASNGTPLVVEFYSNT